MYFRLNSNIIDILLNSKISCIAMFQTIEISIKYPRMYLLNHIDNLSTNHTKRSNTFNNLSAAAGELLECV